MSLTEFLLARIEEDRLTAVQAIGHRAEVSAEWPSSPVLKHINTWSPNRVLAECESKKRVVEHYKTWQETLKFVPGGWTEQTATAYRMAVEWVVLLLTQTYKDHPDFQEEWELL